ncbi:MAG: hypothetical protein V4689_21160 [Verrucomicrobiota bacterium]
MQSALRNDGSEVKKFIVIQTVSRFTFHIHLFHIHIDKIKKTARLCKVAECNQYAAKKSLRNGGVICEKAENGIVKPIEMLIDMI